KAAVEAAIARAKARKAQQQAALAEDAPAEQPAAVDPRKAAVEAAIARAKARKAEQQQQAVPPSAANDDARKAAVAEAIARVQARKASRQAVNED
ncbi:electron transport complex subunit RsxC, partial [Klebsiella michiganensis]|nr:electron transport complex subunit RsxC [Klebsiella michiganensis]